MLRSNARKREGGKDSDSAVNQPSKKKSGMPALVEIVDSGNEPDQEDQQQNVVQEQEQQAIVVQIPDSQNLSFHCIRCSEKFQEEACLQMHFRLNHELSKDFVCDACTNGRDFKSKYCLERHFMSIHEKRIFNCPVSGE